MSSPTFVAHFADGQITRMTTYASLAKLDMGRGVRLSRAAYQSRMKQAAPAIVEAHFERNDEVLSITRASNWMPCHESPRYRSRSARRARHCRNQRRRNGAPH